MACETRSCPCCRQSRSTPVVKPSVGCTSKRRRDARESNEALVERVHALAGASVYALVTCMSFWFAVMFGPVAYVLCLPLIGLGLYRRLRRSLAVALLFSPMMFGHVTGLLEYAERTSDYQNVRRVTEVALVDLEPMCRRPGSLDDATLFGGRWLICLPYHAAIRTSAVLVKHLRSRL